MPGYVTVVTPENVKIDYELAGLASRATATLLDMLIQAVMMGFLWLVWVIVIAGLRINPLSWLTAVLIVVEFVLFWGYYIYFETKWNGQTPGKRSMRLRAIREGGLPIDLGCAALRNLIRPIDITLIGLISIMASRRSQRLGDFAAGTLVVKERLEWGGDLSTEKVPQALDAPPFGIDCVRNIELVTPEEFQAAKRFVERRVELQDDLREALAARIAKPLMVRLGIEDGPHVVYSALLVELYRRCVDERGMR